MDSMTSSERLLARSKLRDAASEERSCSDMAEAGWYVMQVFSGKEAKVCAELRRRLGQDVLEECFSPAYATEKKVRGEWVPHEALLFPGYVIVVTRDVAELKKRLAKVGEFTRLLSMGESFTRLSAGERAWIAAFTEKGRRVMPMSLGVMEGDRVVVFEGPLRGHEAWVSRVDRKRSVAYIELEMFGRTKETKIGLGILSKKPCVAGTDKTNEVVRE